MDEKKLSDELLEHIKNIPPDSCVIVEGKKDKKALESLGVKNIMTLTKPLFAVVEEVASKYKTVLVLTDMDKEGKLLYGKLNSGLSQHGVNVDNKLRNFLLKTQVKQVEGILSLLER